MTFERHPSLSETWINISNASSLPGYYTKYEHTDGSAFSNVFKRNSDCGPLINLMLVPPKYSGTPVDIITDFNAPYGLAMTRHGLLVVSEFCGHRISLWDLQVNKRVGSIGCGGAGMGQFHHPAGVVMTPRDTIMVVDCYNDRIQEFTDDGEFISCVGKCGSGPLQFDKPRGITFHRTGLVYVADRYNHRVQVLNPDFSYSHCFGGFGTRQRKLHIPNESRSGKFHTPYDVAVDSKGFLYVTDCGNSRIQKFTPEGRCVGVFGKEGKKPGELLGPTGLAIEEDVLYITEYLNGRISMYTTEGEYIDVKLHKKIKDPYGVVCNSNSGHLICSDLSNDRLVVLERKN